MKNIQSKEFETINAAMIRTAVSILKSTDAAKDVASTIWEKFAMGGFNKYEDEELMSVMKKSAHNKALDVMDYKENKMKNDGRIISMENMVNGCPSPEKSDEKEIDEIKLERMYKEIDKLTPYEAKLIRMKYIDGLSYEEIVPELGGNVKSLCVRSGRILKKMKIAMCA